MTKPISLIKMLAIPLAGTIMGFPTNLAKEEIYVTQGLTPSSTKTQIRQKPISKEFINSIIAVESSWNPMAVSPKGARGLMQVMPAVWEQYMGDIDTLEMHDPVLNKQVGTLHLQEIESYCEKRHPEWTTLNFEEKRDLLAAAYNGGSYKLRKNQWDISRMPVETRNFVRKIRQDLRNSI